MDSSLVCDISIKYCWIVLLLLILFGMWVWAHMYFDCCLTRKYKIMGINVSFLHVRVIVICVYGTTDIKLPKFVIMVMLHVKLSFGMA